MSERVDHVELREKAQELLHGAFKHARVAALAAALVPLGAVAVNLTAARANASGGAPPPPPPACTVQSAIVSNFNGTRIAEGNVIWFNGVLSVKGVASTPVTLTFTNSTIQFTANGIPYTVAVPDSVTTIDPSATQASTNFFGEWITNVPSSGLAGNTFLDGVPFVVPVGGLPGGINPVTWNGTFESDTPGITISWKWGAAVYTSFSDEYNLNVKPVD